MAIILKKEITLDTIEKELESLLKNVKNYKKEQKEGKEIDLERINDMFIETGMKNRPSLEEISKREFLAELEYQINDEYSYFNERDKKYELSAQDFSNDMYSEHLSNESLPFGYYTWNLDNERALESIIWHNDDYQADIIDYVEEEKGYYLENTKNTMTQSQEFGVYMSRAFNKIIEEKIDEINSEFDFSEFDEKLEDYEINRENLNVGDLKTIYNNLALELGEEPLYSNEEIVKDILKEIEKDKEKEKKDKEY